MSDRKQVPVFILAGGLGTRLSEETQLKPKPMVEIGENPILIHIMRHYYRYGFNDFVICAGYRSWEIKKYFLNYEFRVNHLSIDHRKSQNDPPKAFGGNAAQEKWRVRVIDTGIESMTGARLARAFDEVAKEEPFYDFALTYGDGLSDVDLNAEWEFHREHGKLGTILGVTPTARFGVLKQSAGDAEVQGFIEKPEDRHERINGGFFFFKSGFREYITTNSDCILERAPLEKLARDKQLFTYAHNGFWQPMDTLRDKMLLENLWQSGRAPWALTHNA